MNFIRVIRPGLYTTVQDRGRYGYLSQGVPSSGVMDDYALRMGNILVGNHEGDACLEITLLGPWLEFLSDGIVALTGGDLGALLNGQRFPLWQGVRVKKGDNLQFMGIKQGCRAYLTVAGGINVPVVMGSKSTYTRGNIGGLKGRAICQNDELMVASKHENILSIPILKVPDIYLRDIYNPFFPSAVRVIMGPQEEAFTTEGIRTFLTSEYRVTNEADRMGYRLEGPKISHKKGADIISDGIPFGAIQVPGQGMPIIMMADRQTIGGYTKIATVVSTDLNKIAQSKPGDILRFNAIDIEDAHQIYIDQEDKISTLDKKLIAAEQ